MLARITDYLASMGCVLPEISLLQPADPFLDTTGEDLRRRIFITSQNTGSMLCLRPEFTIPVCRHYMESDRVHSTFGYGGPVFRQRTQGPNEFLQAGYENFGNPNRLQADIDCINCALGLLQACGVDNPKLILGNQQAFTALLEAIDVAKPLRKKLLRAFGDPHLLHQQIETLSCTGKQDLEALPASLQDALSVNDLPKLTQAVAEIMVSDGLPLTGGRTPVAIAERMLEHLAANSTTLQVEQREALEAFLKLDIELRVAADAISAFETDHQISLPGIAESLQQVSAACSGAVDMRYRASFGRRLDYYTGMVFEIYCGDCKKPVIGGGRYDHLLTLLGAKQDIPAVGFAVWIERMEEVS